MSFNWSDYVPLAVYLLDPPPSGMGGGRAYSQEAALRSAASRAYYAAFCHARNYARQHLGFAPTYTARDHEVLRLHLTSRGKANIARELDLLRQWRNSCDYEDGVQFLPVLANAAVSKAQMICATLT